MKGMNEFLEAELEASQTKAADISECGKEITEEPCQKCSQGMVAKHTLSQSVEAGSSQKGRAKSPKLRLLRGGLQYQRRSLNWFMLTLMKMKTLSSNCVCGVTGLDVLLWSPSRRHQKDFQKGT